MQKDYAVHMSLVLKPAPSPGEEVDIDLSHSDQDSPVIWLRVDPDMLWLSKTSIEMPDYMWQAMLLHERDVVYQHMAAEVCGDLSSVVYYSSF